MYRVCALLMFALCAVALAQPSPAPAPAPAPTLASFDWSAGGSYMGVGVMLSSQIYPMPSPSPSSGFAQVAIDTDNERMFFNTTSFGALDAQWVFATESYLLMSSAPGAPPTCFKVNTTYSGQLAQYKKALNVFNSETSTNGAISSYLGYVHDVASCQQPISVSMVTDAKNRLVSWGFGHAISIPISPSQRMPMLAGGSILLDTFTDSVDPALFVLPDSCNQPQDYCATFYPDYIPIP